MTTNTLPLTPSDARSYEADEQAEVLAIAAEIDSLDAMEAREFAMDGAGYDETTGNTYDADNPSPDATPVCPCCANDAATGSASNRHGMCRPCYNDFND
jgi:hypothetical protein